jgi:hypothetical protein
MDLTKTKMDLTKTKMDLTKTKTAPTKTKILLIPMITTKRCQLVLPSIKPKCLPSLFLSDPSLFLSSPSLLALDFDIETRAKPIIL